MNIKYKSILLAAAVAGLGFLASCNNDAIVYEGPSYIMFSDSAMVFPVTQDSAVYTVTVCATRKSESDRTYGIEVLQSESNAIDGYHYTLSSNTITIPAGELTGSIDVEGIYSNIEPEDSLNIRLKLVSLDDQVIWNLYGDEANVLLRKACPFNISDYSGYAVLTSGLLYQINPYDTPKRLITTEAGEGNTILLKDLFSDGYDVTVTVDTDDPFEPEVSIEEGDQIGDAPSFLGTVYGDNAVRVSDVTGYSSYVQPCYNKIILYTLVYVNNGSSRGYVGAFYNELQWISEAEAQDILYNGF